MRKITLLVVATLLFVSMVGVAAFAEMKPSDIVGNWLVMQESSADSDGLTRFEIGYDSYVIFEYKGEIVAASAYNKDGVNHIAVLESGDYVPVDSVTIFTDKDGDSWYHFYDYFYKLDILLKFHNENVVYGYALSDIWTLKIVLMRAGTFDLKNK